MYARSKGRYNHHHQCVRLVVGVILVLDTIKYLLCIDYVLLRVCTVLLLFHMGMQQYYNISIYCNIFYHNIFITVLQCTAELWFVDNCPASKAPESNSR